MKTFTISAIAFYFFYVLNGLMAPSHAQRTASTCVSAIAGIDAGEKSSVPNCKRDALVVQQLAAAVPAN